MGAFRVAIGRAFCRARVRGRHRRFCATCAALCSIARMSKSRVLTNWHPASWHGRPAAQQPKYADPVALERAVAALSRLPPLVVSWEIEALRAKLAQAQRGEAFLLQGGDCAESFEDCESDNIARRLKILLQMSLVLLQGLKKPIIRVGRFAGQYAKPRSADTETRDGVTLPSLPGRQRQPAGVHRGGARAGSGAVAARLRARLAHAQFRARADRRRLCRPASPGVLGPGIPAPRGAARRVSEDRRFDRGVAGVLRVHERARGACGDARGVLHQPRGAAPVVRAGADPLHRAPEEVVQPVDAHAVDRHAHRRHRRRAHRILSRHRQSDRREGRARP